MKLESKAESKNHDNFFKKLTINFSGKFVEDVEKRKTIVIAKTAEDWVGIQP